MKKTFFLITAFLYVATLSINAQYISHSGWLDSANPYGSLTLNGSELYGMTSNHETIFTSDIGYGSIFRTNTSGGIVGLHSFNGTDGANPWGDLTVTGSGSKLYGMTKAGGLNDYGCIFAINSDGTGYQVLLDFNNMSGFMGAYPEGSLSLSLSENILYGMTKSGGSNGLGCIFSINTDGTGYQILLDFDNTNGANPHGSLILSGSKLYGMTENGGANGDGIIFSIDTSGSGYTNLFNFNGTNGANPFGSLTLKASVLYGMTHYGGDYNKGVVFSINTNGSGYNVLHYFDGTNGSNPRGNLTLLGNKLYGMTQNGGPNDWGTIFSIDQIGTNYKSMHHFGTYNSISDDGRFPFGSLTLFGNTFYGMTSQGVYGNGSIFSITSNTTMGINNLTETSETINVYPNPFSTFTTLHSDIYLSNATLTVQNSLGLVKVIRNVSGNSIILQRDNLPNGMYFFKLTQNDELISTGKLVITDN